MTNAIAPPATSTYAIGGVYVRSDMPLWCAPPARDADHEPTITVDAFAGPFPPLGKHRRTAGGRYPGEIEFRTYESDAGMQWIITGVGQFWVSPDGSSIRYTLEAECPATDAEQALIGPVLGMAVQLQGVPLLHAGAVLVDGGAIAMTAPSGAGKSTLTAMLQARGYPVLSDDCVPLLAGDGVEIRRYLPRIKLRGDAADAVGLSDDELTLGPSWAQKRQLLLDPGSLDDADDRSWPLTAVYFLDPTLDEETTGITFDNVPPTTAALAIVAAMYLAPIYTGELPKQAMEAATNLVRQVPVRRVRYPWRLECLPQLADALVADARAIGANGE